MKTVSLSDFRTISTIFAVVEDADRQLHLIMDGHIAGLVAKETLRVSFSKPRMREVFSWSSSRDIYVDGNKKFVFECEVLPSIYQKRAEGSPTMKKWPETSSQIEQFKTVKL